MPTPIPYGVPNRILHINFLRTFLTHAQSSFIFIVQRRDNYAEFDQSYKECSNKSSLTLKPLEKYEIKSNVTHTDTDQPVDGLLPEQPHLLL